MKKKYKVILISGGFDPVHKGHIECIQNAKKLADEVWIGLNNDNWLYRKKGKQFMKEDERKFIMENLKDVDYTYVMNPLINGDDTAIDFIDHARRKYINENGDLPKGVMAFGNGGDRTESTTPENDVCNSYGIDSVWGLGKKIQSSSWLLEKYLNIAE
jgi:D-beta-D-heptose 7-phosphate kinase/D-beta-D-heptose 1-phosphate adenosyltransferase|tara:strand:- start:562 stop:1035 length:474 start_codon:yes stop_codon:yes gene_type:complete